MKTFNKQHSFSIFLSFALLAVVINLLASHRAGYSTTYSDIVYANAIALLTGFIVLYKLKFEFTAKVASALFFNIFFFVFTYYYGLRSLVFIYYVPFVVSYTYLFRDSTTKTEAKIFALTSLGFVLAILLVCTTNGQSILTKEQEVIMYKKNFIVAFALSAYYFYAIFGYLTEQMNLAREASASKARFLSIMSHELRTPLNGIISAINLMDTTNNENEKQKYSAVLKSSSEHLLHLVNNVLDYSKASSGKMQLNPVTSSMDTLIRNLAAVFQSRFEEKNLELDITIAETLKKSVLIDDVRFVQVLTNLLSNALKFTDEGGVSIDAKLVAENRGVLEVQVSVSDSGKGIAPDQHGKIFESFNNVDHQTNKVESTGLGLSISKRIVEIMGGELEMQSQLNVGSRFFFTLLLPLAEVKKEPIERVDTQPSSLEGIKILIAEDNPINMMVAREFLKRWNVTIIEAQNGLIAQKLLIQHSDVDLLLLDLQMPEMNGYELMSWIRKSAHTLPVIAFTAQIMAVEEKMDLFQLGFTDMIPKPFAPPDLQQKIQTALMHRKQLQKAV